MATRKLREPDENTAALLLRAQRVLAERIDGAVLASGLPVRPVHAAVFIHMDQGGIRLTDLAARAQMTPQSMAELVDDLVEAGLLERGPDPTDRRAKLIVFTERGLDAVQVALDAIVDLERDLAQRLGRARLRQLQATLRELAAD